MDIMQFIPDKADFSLWSGLGALISFVGAVLLGLIVIVSFIGALIMMVKYVFHLLGRNSEKASVALGVAGKLGLVFLGFGVGWGICVAVLVAILNSVGAFTGGGAAVQ